MKVPTPSRCFLGAWVAAWITAVFLPSAAIAYLGISPAAAIIGIGFDRLPASTWKVADDVGPAVKLMIGGLLLVGFLGLGRFDQLKRAVRLAASIVVGLIAVAATISLIPSSFSRGFARALTGTRFDPSITSIYLTGGALAGVIFAVALGRCDDADARRRKASLSG